MKKLVVFLIILFQILNSFSQNNNGYGVVYYNFKPNNSEILNNDKLSEQFKNLYTELNNYSTDVKFIMEFNNKSSIFKITDDLNSDYKPFANDIADRLVGKGSYYCNLERDIQLRKIEGENFLIKSHPSNIEWILTQETKFINKIKCFKAKTTVTKINSSGEYIFEIVAWYAPEIPVSFGPKQFNGLPGLILELKDTHYTFFVDKIELFPSKKIVIKPFKGKVISEEEYKSKTREMMRGLFINSKNY